MKCCRPHLDCILGSVFHSFVYNTQVNWDFPLPEDDERNSKRTLATENTVYTYVLQRKWVLFWLTGWQHCFSGVNNMLYLVIEWSPSGYHVLVLFYFHKCSCVTNTFSFSLILPMASLHSTNVKKKNTKNKQSKNYPLLFPTHPQSEVAIYGHLLLPCFSQKVCHSASCF